MPGRSTVHLNPPEVNHFIPILAQNLKFAEIDGHFLWLQKMKKFS